MEGTAFGILLLSGLASSLFDRHYVFIDNPTTFHQATKYCRQKYTDLATIYDKEDMTKLAGQTRDVPVFLGLHRVFRWSLSDDDDYKEGEELYWNWASGHVATEQCVSIGPTGKWIARRCSNSFKFLCYNASVTDISKRFTLGNGSLSWTGAQAYCRDRHTDLARVRNGLDNQQLQEIVSDEWAWIGLSRASWIWLDRTEASFKPWQPSVPQVHSGPKCVTFQDTDNGYGIRAADCEKKQAFCCYIAPKRKHLLRLKLKAGDSSVNMNHPAVVASIWKWVQTKLRDGGVSKEVRIRWWTRPKKLETEVIDEPHTCV